MNSTLGFLFLLSGIFVLLIALGVFWSIKSGQFDDLEGPAYRVLMDNDKVPEEDGEATKPPGPKAGDGSV